jgi:hypothetical protein
VLKQVVPLHFKRTYEHYKSMASRQEANAVIQVGRTFLQLQLILQDEHADDRFQPLPWGEASDLFLFLTSCVMPTLHDQNALSLHGGPPTPPPPPPKSQRIVTKLLHTVFGEGGGGSLRADFQVPRNSK